MLKTLGRSLGNIKQRMFLLDTVALVILWYFPLYFFDASLIQEHIFFLVFFPVTIQLLCYSILGNYDAFVGAILMSRRRLIINAILGFLLTFFVYKFFTLTLYSSFYVRVRYWFLIIYPLQVLLYYIFMLVALRRSNFMDSQKVCVLGNKQDLDRMRNWFIENKISEGEFNILTMIDTNSGQIVNLTTNEATPITRALKLFDILKKHDIVVYFTNQILDTREARNLLRFGAESGSFFDFGTFCGLVREIYPVDAIDTDWYVRKSTNLWVKISLYLRFRRMFDFVSALLLLLLTLPLWIFATVLIFFTSSGPIFYTQERIGRFGNKFRIIKFRTMKQDAESTGPQFATSADSRVTMVGRLLRRTRIDELPQVINVLKGEMCLIGPRPEREHFETILNKDLPLLQLRNFIAPGITGLAQVNSDYANDVASYKKKLGYDLYYILNLSPLLDLSILLRTVRTVIFKKGS